MFYNKVVALIRSLARPKRRVVLCLIGSLYFLAPGVSGQVLQARSDDDFDLARNLYRDAGDYATSAELFSEFIRNYPRHRYLSEARFLLARSLARSGRCEQAVPAYEQFYSEHPDHLSIAEAHQERAGCWELLGEFKQAAQAYQSIQRLFPSGDYAALALLKAAINYTKAQEWSLALTSYEALVVEYPDDPLAPRAQYNMAQIAFASGKNNLAEDLLAQVINGRQNDSAVQDALLLSGRIQLFLDKPSLAKQTFNSLHQRYTNSAHADSSWLELGTYYLEKEAFNSAFDTFDRAHKKISDLTLKDQAKKGSADALRLDGQHFQALQHYQELLKNIRTTTPMKAEAQLGIAISHGHTNRFAESVALFLRLIQQTADGTTKIRARATRELAALYRRNGDLTRSATWFRHYLNEAQENPLSAEDQLTQSQVRLHLAKVLDASGYSEESIDQFKKLVQSGSILSAPAQLGIAQAYENNGQPALALLEYRTFLERFPTHGMVAKARLRDEYLREFTILDQKSLDGVIRQAWLDELGGSPKQAIRFRVAKALRDYRDYSNAVRQLEAYVAAYIGHTTVSEAHYYLADCLFSLSRQRHLEALNTVSDSLSELAYQEFRILATDGTEPWQGLARFRLLDEGIDDLGKKKKLSILQERLSTLRQIDRLNTEMLAAAELKLANAHFQAATDPQEWQATADAYRKVLNGEPSIEHFRRARFGIAVSNARYGNTPVAIDSLEVLLADLAGGGSLVPRVLLELGQALLAENKIVLAAARFQELLLAFPFFSERQEVQIALASARYKLGDFPGTIKLLSQAQESNSRGPYTERIRRHLAIAYESNGEKESALELYEKILADWPSATYSDSMRLARARLLQQLGHSDNAIEQFEELLDGKNVVISTIAAKAAGDLHFLKERYDRALKNYAATAAQNEISMEGRQAICLFRMGRIDDAKRTADVVLNRLPDNNPWNWILAIENGRHFLRTHQYEKALKIFRRVEKQGQKSESAAMEDTLPEKELIQMANDPKTAGSYYLSTALWKQNLQEPTEERTARALDSQINFVKKHGNSLFGAAVHLRLGHYYRGVVNQLLPAAGAFRHVIDGNGSIDQKHEAFWFLLQCYKNLSEWDESYRIARRLLAEYPNHPKAHLVHLEIGYILKERGQYSQAIEYLESVLEWAQGDIAAQARYYIGESFQEMGQYRDAIERYYRVSFHGSGAYTGWINSADFKRAQCHEELGEFEQAANIYDRIIRREGKESEFGKIANKGLIRVVNAQ